MFYEGKETVKKKMVKGKIIQIKKNTYYIPPTSLDDRTGYIRVEYGQQD